MTNGFEDKNLGRIEARGFQDKPIRKLTHDYGGASAVAWLAMIRSHSDTLPPWEIYEQHSTQSGLVSALSSCASASGEYELSDYVRRLLDGSGRRVIGTELSGDGGLGSDPSLGVGDNHSSESAGVPEVGVSLKGDVLRGGADVPLKIVPAAERHISQEERREGIFGNVPQNGNPGPYKSSGEGGRVGDGPGPVLPRPASGGISANLIGENAGEIFLLGGDKVYRLMLSDCKKIVEDGSLLSFYIRRRFPSIFRKYLRLDVSRLDISSDKVEMLERFLSAHRAMEGSSLYKESD